VWVTEAEVRQPTRRRWPGCCASPLAP